MFHVGLVPPTISSYSHTQKLQTTTKCFSSVVRLLTICQYLNPEVSLTKDRIRTLVLYAGDPGLVHQLPGGEGERGEGVLRPVQGGRQAGRHTSHRLEWRALEGAGLRGGPVTQEYLRLNVFLSLVNY